MDWLLTPWISLGGAVLLAVIVVMAVTARRPKKPRIPKGGEVDPAAMWLHGTAGHDHKPGRDAPGNDDGDEAGTGGGGGGGSGSD